MHPDIEKAIELIDHKIVELQKAKRTLIEAFGERATQAIPSIGTTKTTRKQAVMKLLQEEGPLTRQEIIQKSSFPLGTVSFILNDKTVFKNRKGKWGLIEETGQEQQKEIGKEAKETNIKK